MIGITFELQDACEPKDGNNGNNYAASSSVWDIDDSGSVDALTDGLLLMRYFFDFRGEALIEGAIDLNGKRTDASEIQAYIESYIH